MHPIALGGDAFLITLYDVLSMEQVSSTVINENEGHYHYILDLAAKLRTITSAPKTFEDLGMKILREIPNKYNSLYIALVGEKT